MGQNETAGLGTLGAAATGPGGELTRRERRKLEVRSRILDASISLFEKLGIEGTRVVEICERADVAHKTFFNHFQSKRELLREIARDGLEQLLANIEEARKLPASTGERVQHFFERIAENADDAGPMHRELLSEIVRAAHEDSEQEQARRLHDAFAAIIDDGLRRGEVTDRHSAETLTEMLMGGYYVLMFNWANLPEYPLHERALETSRFLTDAIAVGLGTTQTAAETVGPKEEPR
jgi:AcrR family transcriptional regulator